MERIHINGSTSYNVFIEQGILGRMGNLLREEIGGDRALVVTDSNVAALYLDVAVATLEDSGYDTYSAVLEPGDASKNIDNYYNILTALADKGFSSSDVVVALGGGMIGDLAGFAAATYKRGSKCAQVPTSLMADVDSSIGGKTAINLPSGKNQVGIIRNPSIVVIDPATLATLSPYALQEAYAEIIKYGILGGYTIIGQLREAVRTGDYTQVICSSLCFKRDVVELDEGDKGLRQFLNLGHLVGHAIEAFHDYSVSHGQAVAEGLAIETRCAFLAGLISIHVYTEVTALLAEFDFSIFDRYRIENLEPYLMTDKRLRDDYINIIIPRDIGDCTLYTLPTDQLIKYIRRGL